MTKTYFRRNQIGLLPVLITTVAVVVVSVGNGFCGELPWIPNDGTIGVREGERKSFNNTSDWVDVTFSNAAPFPVEVRIVGGDSIIQGYHDTVQWTLRPGERQGKTYQVFKNMRTSLQISYRRWKL